MTKYIKKQYADSELTGKIIESAFKIYNELGYGYPEKIYQEALLKLLSGEKLKVEKERYCKLEIDGSKIGYFFIDLVIEEKVAVELKARDEILNKDISQTLTYLKLHNLKTGLILAFTKSGVKIKRLIL